MDYLQFFQHTERQRVSDGQLTPLIPSGLTRPLMVLILSQLGDFDSLEYAWWLQKDADFCRGVDYVAVGIGDRRSGQKFCDYTGFPAEKLFIDPNATIHQELGLYRGLTWKIPGLKAGQNAWVNLMLMCAGIGSPGTLKEVLRGYTGDKKAPQLFADDEVVKAAPLPALKGEFFAAAGGKGFQRPLELATLRLRNMAEVLGNWSTYVPDAQYMTQRGATFLFAADGTLQYEHFDQNILGFAANMSRPLTFLETLPAVQRVA
ncbi:peroxiredoxin-like family protein [Synechococcus sp. BDU 130192]|uniref:peroxiredoxin-like family protein n=1 Tax=Synechococcus sp. BDU 130192 TaxID=2042059 RepID=UPI000C072F31|nr:peroxiredoxin-like family protein [Synechococcus sp. BDU 130192]